ncbi:hypothetical protein DFQ27_003299, partial [Actinomortierella ambigua]
MKLSIAAAIGLLALSVTDAAVRKANPLPKPVTIDWKAGGRINLPNTIVFNFRGPWDNILADAANRTKAAIEKKWVPRAWETPMPVWPKFPDQYGDNKTASAGSKRAVDSSASATPVWSVDLHVLDVTAPLQHGHDESYTISVSASGILIKANTVWGGLHGLSTFEQLVIAEKGKDQLFIEQPVEIVDKPKYTHRGVMYDTARNFLPVSAIKKQIDALAFSKLNVFHWHITDSQSWPLEVDPVKYPDFTKGAYSESEVYEHRHVREVVDYGRKRGVR